MQTRWYPPDDPAALIALRDDITPFLCQHEAVNCVVLGIHSAFDTAPPEFACGVFDDRGQPLAYAVRMPGKPVAVSVSATPAAARELSAALISRDGWNEVSGDADTAWAVASALSERVARPVKTKLSLGVYACRRVTPPTSLPPGGLRSALPTDEDVLVKFNLAFELEAIGTAGTEPAAREWSRKAIQDGRPHVWQLPDGEIVSCCCWAGPTPHGIRVSFVYTPPERRGRGYAGAAVATLTQKLLDTGRQFIFLFTDLEYPTSNRLYGKLGYEQVGENAHLCVG